MSECDRIIKEGVIGPSFLKEEMRDDFLVDKERKKLWAISLDLLLKFDEVCKNKGLHWFLSFGSLLGAIRHKGFIPWDDDVDVFMLREDFDKLLYLEGEFDNPYFLQTPYTDPSCFITTIRLRNSNTAYIDGPFMYQGFNQGISIAIAPLDYVPENAEEKYIQIKELILDNSIYMRLTNPHLSERDKKRVKGYLNNSNGKDPLRTYERIHQMAREVLPSQNLWTVASQPYSMERSVFLSEDFKDSVLMDFEGFKFPVCKGYDHVLSVIYGDYMKFPSMEERGSRHINAGYYPDTPYKEILPLLLK